MGWNQTYSEKDVQIWTNKMTNAVRDRRRHRHRVEIESEEHSIRYRERLTYFNTVDMDIFVP